MKYSSCHQSSYQFHPSLCPLGYNEWVKRFKSKKTPGVLFSGAAKLELSYCSPTPKLSSFSLHGISFWLFSVGGQWEFKFPSFRFKFDVWSSVDSQWTLYLGIYLPPLEKWLTIFLASSILVKRYSAWFVCVFFFFLQGEGVFYFVS